MMYETKSLLLRALAVNLSLTAWLLLTRLSLELHLALAGQMLGQAILHELRHGPWDRTVTWFLCVLFLLIGFGLGRIRRTWEKARRHKVEEYTRGEERRTA